MEDYQHVIFDELDLQREAANTSQLRRNFEDSDLLYVPQVYWDYTRNNVFVMERTKDRLRVSSWIDRVKKGSQRTTIVWKDLKDSERAIETASAELQRRLTAAGLFDRASQ